MLNSDDLVPGIAPARRDFGRATLRKGAAEIAALDAYYFGLKFDQLRLTSAPVRILVDNSCTKYDLVALSINVRGPFDLLVAHGFAHPSWRALPPCGTKNRWTDGFGNAIVKLLKSGEYSLGYLCLDTIIDRLAVAILPLYWNPRSMLGS